MAASIALIVDKPDWAFHRIAKMMRAHSNARFKFSIYFSELMNTRNFLNNEAHEFDLVHVFWRPNTILAPSERPYKLTTAIYDHLYIDNRDLNRKILQVTDAIYCSSEKISDIYRNEYGVELEICMDGVDLVAFAPPRFKNVTESPLRIGWAGKSKALGNDHKGFNKIVLPLIHELEINGIKSTLVPADASRRQLSFSEMPKYYRGLDVFLCTSISEGTPNPLLEAAASGVPWISTDVGIVRNLAGPKQCEFILNQEVNEFYAAIKKLSKDFSLRSALSLENLKQVRDFSWNITLESHFKFFERSLNQK
jgi:glycosyltransferase involved in cell wall biosynthesis